MPIAIIKIATERDNDLASNKQNYPVCTSKININNPNSIFLCQARLESFHSISGWVLKSSTVILVHNSSLYDGLMVPISLSIKFLESIHFYLKKIDITIGMDKN